MLLRFHAKEAQVSLSHTVGNTNQYRDQSLMFCSYTVFYHMPLKRQLNSNSQIYSADNRRGIVYFEAPTYVPSDASRIKSGNRQAHIVASSRHMMSCGRVGVSRHSAILIIPCTFIRFRSPFTLRFPRFPSDVCIIWLPSA